LFDLAFGPHFECVLTCYGGTPSLMPVEQEKSKTIRF